MDNVCHRPPGLTAPEGRRQTRRNTAVVLRCSRTAQTLALRGNSACPTAHACPVRAAQRAPAGPGLDGHQGSTLSNAVQDDMAACTACKAAPLRAVVFRYAVTAHWGAPRGRMGGRLRARREGRTAAAARAQQTDGWAGLTFMTGRLAAPDVLLRVAPCLAVACTRFRPHSGPDVLLCASRTRPGRGRQT
jgi:hypothetical protein